MSFFQLLAVLAASISLVSLTLVLVLFVITRREPPDVADLKSRLLALDQEVTDVNDRLGQWMRRQSVRRMQEAKAASQTAQPANLGDRKAELRARARGVTE